MSAPIMSIGIIFKNDIRCIERCLKALQPLRDAVPCELVMADTGSTDGSREIALKYADILVDFPWIDDFAAARNAVLDRCSGLWHFAVDTDEYLDPDVSELINFLSVSDDRKEQIAMVNIRNYNSYDMTGNYSDFSGGRILRMSTGVRYEGAIHEHFNYPGEMLAYPLMHTILHHDGYAGLHDGSEKGKEKTRRNLRMIKKALEEEPESLLLRLQLIESGSGDSMPDYEEQVRQAVRMVREKQYGWERLGPAILRSAIYAAEQMDLPEWAEWVALAEEWFPQSMFTRLDIQYAAFAHDWNEGKAQDKALVRGEKYLKALQDYRNGVDLMSQIVSPLQMATPFSECEAKINLINSYCVRNRFEEAFELAKGLDYVLLNETQINKLLSALQDIHFRTALDTAPIILHIWEMVSDPEQSTEKAAIWRSALVKVAGNTFLHKSRQAEQKKADFVRHAYSLYCPLRGKIEVGTAASIMEMEDRTEIEAALAEVKDWNAFSIHALAHALEQGARFPLPDKPVNIEAMDSLATRLAKDREGIIPLAVDLSVRTSTKDWPGMVWAREVLIATLRAYPWNGKKRDGMQGVTLARAFAKLEETFLPLCYNVENLKDEKLFALPPLHRFGWYCSRAFDALEAGDQIGYVRLLRAGLESCGGMKPMVEFLLENTPELQTSAPSAELQTLAEQIRTVLANFAPDDPAVAALKQSEAYRKVAHLIEGIEVPVVGGLKQ